MKNNLRAYIEHLVQQGKDMVYIADCVHLNMSQMRYIILKNEIYPCENDSELEYFNFAMTLKTKLNEVYFISDLAKITNIPLTITKKICEMYSLKPTKKAICKVCGVEISIDSSRVVRKYCSKECYKEYRNNRKHKQCIQCNTKFRGKSKFCSSNCKTLHDLIRSSIKCLKDL